MSHRRWIILGLLTLWLLTPRRAAAEINVGDSVDWLVAVSDVIARCRVVEIVEDEPTPAHPWRRVTFEVIYALKGSPGQRIIVRTYAPTSLEQLNRLRETKDAPLVFFTRTAMPPPESANPYEAGLAKYPLRLADTWNLSRPSRRGSGLIAFTSDLRVLRSPKEIDAAVCDAIAADAKPIVPPPYRSGPFDWFSGPVQGGPGQPYALRLDAGFGDVFSELWAGSSVYLRVPLNTRTEQLAYQWLDNNEHRDAVISILRFCRSDRSIALFKSLLQDPSYQAYGYGGPAMTWQHNVRRIAYDTLVDWGIETPKPAIDMPVDGYTALSWFPLPAMAVALLILGLGGHVIRRRRGAARPGFATIAADAVVTLLILLAGFVAFTAWWNRSVPEVTADVGRSQCWLWLHDRRVTLACARDWQYPRPLSAAMFDRIASPDGRWNLPNSGTTADYMRLGCRYTSGRLTPQISTRTYGGPGTPSAYVTIQLPLWATLTILLAVPAARVATVARGRIRRRRRERNGQCVVCGYDLRGGHDQCPECGALAPTPAPLR